MLLPVPEQLQALAAVQEEAALRRAAQGLPDPLVGLEVAEGAMDRHHAFGLNGADEIRQVLPEPMPRDVDHAQIIQGGFRPQPGRPIQHSGDGQLVAGNGPGAQNEAVAGQELDGLHLAAEDASQGALGLPLAAGRTRPRALSAGPA